MQEIKGNPQVYTTQEGTKNWIQTNLYQETALCLDSFFWLKVEASTINLYNYYLSLVPECLCQARLFLTDIIAISHDISTTLDDVIIGFMQRDIISRDVFKRCPNSFVDSLQCHESWEMNFIII